MAIENYSQNDEQKYIINFFKDKVGRFLDIGAYDGVMLSNTYALSLSGWRGVLVEPSPQNYSNLCFNYCKSLDINKFHFMKVAVGSKDGEILFYDTPKDFYGSIIKGNGNKYGVSEEPIIVECITCETLFSDDYDFDFISLDVEGNNFEVLKSIPFDKLSKLTLICVETDGKFNGMAEYLAPFGFKELHRTPENIILWR